MVSLDDPNAAQRFVQPPGNLGGDFAAFTKDGANEPEDPLQDENKDDNHRENNQRQAAACVHQKAEDEDCGQQAAGEFHQAGAQ